MHAEYLHAINVDKRKRAVDFILDEIKTKCIDFDTIAVRGFSATSIGSMVAYLLEKPLCYIRKKEETCCSWNRVEFDGDKIGRFLIIDDLIDSGNTVTEIIKSAIKHDESAECVGCILYRTRYYYPRENLMKLIGMELPAPPPPPQPEQLPDTLAGVAFSSRRIFALDIETYPLNPSYPVQSDSNARFYIT